MKNVELIIDNQLSDSVWTPIVNYDHRNECWSVVWRLPWDVAGMSEELSWMHISEYLEYDI